MIPRATEMKDSLRSECTDALAGEVAAVEALEQIATRSDALPEALATLTSEPARQAFWRVIRQALEVRLPAAGKATAIALYATGIVSQEATDQAFARHPEWVHA